MVLPRPSSTRAARMVIVDVGGCCASGVRSVTAAMSTTASARIARPETSERRRNMAVLQNEGSVALRRAEGIGQKAEERVKGQRKRDRTLFFPSALCPLPSALGSSPPQSHEQLQ